MSVRGWVYVLTNKAIPGLVKIGYSTKDPSLRADELHTTGLPYPFEVVYDVLVMEPRDVEQKTHNNLRAEGHHEAKEFFRLSVDLAVLAVRSTIRSQNKEILLENFADSVEALIAASPSAPQEVPNSDFHCPKCRTLAIVKGKPPSLIRCSGCGLDFKPPVRDSADSFNPAADWPFAMKRNLDAEESAVSDKAEGACPNCHASLFPSASNSTVLNCVVCGYSRKAKNSYQAGAIDSKIVRCSSCGLERRISKYATGFTCERCRSPNDVS